MAMPQRDDTIEAIKRRAAEKKAAEEKRRPRCVPAPRTVAVTGCGEGVNVGIIYVQRQGKSNEA